ncbi:MAG: hypothetical protein J5641_05650 [Bacteroidales bacterium]|nr:hypothetical protein [Bacteroidales bacterium]
MKKTLLALLLTLSIGTVCAQNVNDTIHKISFDTVGADTTRAIAIIDRYVKMVDFSLYRTDSVLAVTSQIIDRDHPNDTMTIYRWYMAPRYNRIEIWQNGRMENGYYSDGIKLFRSFHQQRREWANLTPESYFYVSMPLDIRGALYNWRGKGAEVYYAGEFNFKGKALDRVFVTSPSSFDRYYYFEKESGLLGLVTEDEHMYGDAKKTMDYTPVDWRAWHEFVPLRGNYLPSEESYQVGQQVVTIHNSYRYEAPQTKLFTEDFVPKR